MNRRLISLGWLAIALATLLSAPTVTTAQIQVTSASPDAAPQGTTNLNVTVTGNGFKKGAKTQWFVTGTTNPGGVTVNSTAFNNSGQLTANITIASGAVISGYDIVVTNADGRTGKGTEKFAVTIKGTPVGCTTVGTPNGFTLVTELNPVQPNGAALITTLNLGNAIRVRPVDLNGDHIVDTLVAFVTSGTSSGAVEATYAFFLDPVTGLAQTKNPVTGAPWQNPLLLLTGVRNNLAAAGDVNGDGVPDFVMAGVYGPAYLFVGSVTGGNAPNPYTPSYTAYQIAAPAGAPSNWGAGVALGDLDGDRSDEIAVGATPGKHDSSLPAVFVFKFAAGALTLLQKIQDPTGQVGGFGDAIAIGSIDGNPGNDLVVGAPGNNTNGAVYVFPVPVQQSNFFTLSGSGPNFGEKLGIADIDGNTIPDLVVITGAQFNGSDTTAKALVYLGPVFQGDNYTNQLLPATGLAYSWGAPNTDVGDILTTGAIAVGSPNATTCNTQIGAVHLFTAPLAASQQPNYLFQPPSLVSTSNLSFGYGVGLVPGYPFLLVGDHIQSVGTTADAGQVYVYKKN